MVLSESEMHGDVGKVKERIGLLTQRRRDWQQSRFWCESTHGREGNGMEMRGLVLRV